MSIAFDRVKGGKLKLKGGKQLLFYLQNSKNDNFIKTWISTDKASSSYCFCNLLNSTGGSNASWVKQTVR
ncbi:hypothetical protein T4E_10463 [Trichinella pseudospiralis]|uniref:Uncharacterized protein n=1 Tax=Trichinella pseudospiralis TaxID=6337 RepID=A0A0V0XE16_TRIPS|nr:hypothetical protein T4E_10463 [Trichinella pseudospiralis]